MEESSYLSQILLLVCLVILSAVFSSAETALTSLSAVKRKKLGSEYPVVGKFLTKLFEKPGKMLTTILVGNNIVNIMATSISTLIFIQWLNSLGIQNKIVVTATSTLFMTLILLIFGEITPKTFALKKAEGLAIILGRPIYYLSIALSPVIIILNKISKTVIKLVGGRQLEKDSLVSEDEIKILINMGVEEGVLEVSEEKMLNSIIEFGDIIVREIMTPRTAIIAVDSKTPIRKVVDVISKNGHSRIPVFSERLDNIIGFIYAKDLLTIPPDKNDSISFAQSLMRDPHYVPETKKIDELLNEMKRNKIHIAVVVDEYGGTSGLVTIEDILEEIVGEIQDEYDLKEEERIVKVDDNKYVVSGMINVGYLNRELEINLSEDDDYDSLAGFMVNKLGKIPIKGDIYENRDLRITVVNVIRRRITKLKLEILEKEGDHVENG